MFGQWDGRAKARMRGLGSTPSYPFYTVVGDQIESGWEYREDAKDRVDELKEEAPRGLKIRVMTAAGAQRAGITGWHNHASLKRAMEG